MRSRKIRRRRKRLRLWLIILLGPMLWLGQRQVSAYFQTPQAALVLGGAAERERFAAVFAQQHPDIEIWVSSGTNPEYAEWVFTEANIDLSRIKLDYRAVDTVTNFTTLVDDLKSEGITRVYLITSDYHMRRASIIAQIVLASREISFQPIPVPSDKAPESLTKGLRDGARAMLWLFTGHTGSTLSQTFGKR
ncbi:MAG: YdcF family protein [Pseudanabaenales cyanobacterium]|nr:YdcF family protein [Pseudanabaenales cyanobacterium]